MGLTRISRMIKYGKPIIVVSGLPRSGTSMLMKMLNASGIAIASDGVRDADDDNPKGYFELERIKDLDKERDKTWLKDLRGKVVKIVSYFLQNLPDDNNYKVIFIERSMQEVIASQNKMLERKGIPVDKKDDDKMIKNFTNHIAKVKTFIDSHPAFEVLYVSHQGMIKNPLQEAARICRFLGGNLDANKMASMVDPSLYRNRA